MRDIFNDKNARRNDMVRYWGKTEIVVSIRSYSMFCHSALYRKRDPPTNNGNIIPTTKVQQINVPNYLFFFTLKFFTSLINYMRNTVLAL